MRTWFDQLISGMEFLKAKRVANLDLKPDNILFDENWTLRICDFDHAFTVGDPAITSKGTPNFRAPELVNKSTKDPYAADIYSAGILLYTMCVGSIPYSETEPIIDGCNL